MVDLNVYQLIISAHFGVTQLFTCLDVFTSRKIYHSWKYFLKNNGIFMYLYFVVFCFSEFGIWVYAQVYQNNANKIRQNNNFISGFMYSVQ